jgi:hypothetical protein
MTATSNTQALRVQHYRGCTSSCILAPLISLLDSLQKGTASYLIDKKRVQKNIFTSSFVTVAMIKITEFVGLNFVDGIGTAVNK